MKWLEMVLTLARSLGDKLPQAWPHVLAIAAALKAILVIANDGRPIAGAQKYAEGSGEADELAKLAMEKGINTTQAYEVASTLRMAEDRLSG